MVTTTDREWIQASADLAERIEALPGVVRSANSIRITILALMQSVRESGLDLVYRSGEYVPTYTCSMFEDLDVQVSLWLTGLWDLRPSWTGSCTNHYAREGTPEHAAWASTKGTGDESPVRDAINWAVEYGTRTAR